MLSSIKEYWEKREAEVGAVVMGNRTRKPSRKRQDDNSDHSSSQEKVKANPKAKVDPKNNKVSRPVVEKPKQKLIPGAAKPAGKGNIHLGRWFEEEDAKPKAKAVRKVPSFGSKPKGGKK